jgi:hypothetical protein
MIEPNNMLSDDGDHAEDAPPFALPESSSSKLPQHQLIQKRVGFLPESLTMFSKEAPSASEQPLSSSMSDPPGLAESVYTDASSTSPSACEEDESSLSAPAAASSPSQLLLNSTSSQFMLSSIPTVTSNHYLGESSSSQLRSIDLTSQHNNFDFTIPSAGERSSQLGDSVGFSQLLDAANNDGRVSSRIMPSVPEEEVLREQDSNLISLGTLISTPSSPASVSEDATTQSSNRAPGWFPNIFRATSTGDNDAATIENDLNSPLLESTASLSSASALLSYEPSPMSIAQAREGIMSTICTGDSFEISMKLTTECTVEEMMNILANPSLLKLWCAPINALVVTQSSEGAASSYHSSSEQGREYEGEWVEATTGSLQSPPSNIGYLEKTSQAVMDAIGFSSYGSVRMFIERRRGQVGLTVGPFSGGIHAAHKLSVEQGPDGLVRVIDRVRLAKQEEDLGLVSSMYLCGMMDRLERCLLPSVSAYMEQTVDSLAKLRVLSRNENLRNPPIIP